ncbi:hypothetical protein [Glaciimonas sp. PAMC28666]|uniref:hypothetical protein n=1 Tax=Glaciimonas sp. PAMC28666 TaxID=2807626 RepID=UPI001963AD1B|nr:hypothetical protein [Glaciimonas sp. PAMC28666]QRX84371.1 hypothetical protein JQN73_09430 [Glaciimonas sp. PAMC28666]
MAPFCNCIFDWNRINCIDWAILSWSLNSLVISRYPLPAADLESYRTLRIRYFIYRFLCRNTRLACRETQFWPMNVNNRQLHQSERDWAKQNAKKYREHLQEKTGENISAEEAYQRLLSAGYAIVDSAAERGGKSDETAKQFIAENKTSTLFKATAAERTNPFSGGNVDGSWTPEQQARFGLKTPAEVASKLVTNANDYLGKSCSDNCGAKFDAINDALLALEATKPLYQDDLGSINLINAQINLLKNGITETELVRGAAQSIAETDKAIAAALLGSGVKPAIPNNLVSSTVKAKLLTKLEQSGTKLTPENVVAIKKLTDGRIVFLEQGNSKGGCSILLNDMRQILQAKAFLKRMCLPSSCKL